MQTISATAARRNIFRLIEEVNHSSDPLIITNANGKNAVLLSEDDWGAIEETIYLNSIPGMAESILAAKEEPPAECTEYKKEEEW